MAQEARSRGVVRWFSDSKGYGFIKPDNDDEELFVHHSSIKSDGFRTLTEGATVEFTFALGDDNKPKAIDVTGPNGSPIQPPSSGGRRSFGGGGRGGGRRNNSSNGGECYSCGEVGHIARECPEKSRGFGGGSGSGGGACHNCGKFGHFARECRSGGRGGGDGACYTCGEFGHLARHCQAEGGSSGGRLGGGRYGGGGGSGGDGCYNCGKPGHFARDCPNRD